MRIEFTSDLVGTLKGAPLSCFVLLLFAKQPLSAQYLERHSRFSDKSVNSALLFLSEMGLITRNGRYNWQIASNVTQLPLMMGLLEEENGAAKDNHAEIIDSSESESPVGVGEIPSRRNSESENFRVPVENRVKKAKNTPKKPIESEKFRVDCPSTTSYLTTIDSKEDLVLEADFKKIEVLNLLDEFGVMEPKRSQLAAMPGVTARLVEYHLRKCEDVPLAIWRIERAWRVPKNWQPVKVDAPLNPPISESEMEGSDVDDLHLEAFARAMERLRPLMANSEFCTWCEGLRLVAVEESPQSPLQKGGQRLVTVGAGNQRALAFVRKYLDELTAGLTEELGCPVSVEMIVR